MHFLSHLSDYDIAKIANLAQDGKYKKHQFIVKEGDDGDTFFILTEMGRQIVDRDIFLKLTILMMKLSLNFNHAENINLTL